MVPDHEVYAEMAHPGVLLLCTLPKSFDLLLTLFQLLLLEETIFRGYDHSDCGRLFTCIASCSYIHVHVSRVSEKLASGDG